ncbi:MAG TPA: two-component regulator propeller domain-containing protein, partial [Candidatus Dormibacteraeota bacterium]|nr:two-component regulator propeller domain-containing protein [Candidatus Dormibacteraeota bacterium]
MLPLWLVAAWLPVAGLAASSDDPASAWLARNWQADDGLPNDTVTGIAQTSDGFLWVTTANRLARFD